jgi:hypothetical protein
MKQAHWRNVQGPACPAKHGTATRDARKLPSWLRRRRPVCILFFFFLDRRTIARKSLFIVELPVDMASSSRGVLWCTPHLFWGSSWSYGRVPATRSYGYSPKLEQKQNQTKAPRLSIDDGLFVKQRYVRRYNSIGVGDYQVT